MRISDFMVDKFKKGSVPDGTATDEEIQMTTDLLFATMEWTKVDFENGLFKEFNEYTTSVKVTLKNIQDAMAFNIYHEGLHLGTILALQKML